MASGARDVFLESIKTLERQSAAIVEISRFARSSAKNEVLLSDILERVMALVGADAGAVLLANTNTGSFEFVTAHWAGRSALEAAERQKALKLFQVKLNEGIAGQVFQTQEPVLLPDVARNAAFRKDVSDAAQYDVANMLVVPLLSEDGPRGVIELFNKKPKGTFTAADMQLAVALANQIALILDVHRLRAQSQGAVEVKKAPDNSAGELMEARRAARDAQTQLSEAKRLLETSLQVQDQAKGRLKDLTEERDRYKALAEAATPAEYMTRLLKSVEPIAFNLSVDIVVKNFMELAARLVEAQAAQIFLWDERADRLVLAASTAPVGAGIAVSFKKGEGLAGAAAERMDLLAVTDVTRDDHFSKSIDEVPGVLTRTVLAAPLASHGRLIGVVEAINKKDGGVFTSEDAVALGGVALMGAEAVDKVLRHRETLNAHRAVLARLADLMESRQPGEAGRHERLRQMAALVAESLGVKEVDRQDMDWAALLFNTGLVTVPPDVAAKRTELTPVERDMVVKAGIVAADILAAVPGLDGPAKVLRHVHERWDGEGAPEGLAEEKIPYGARILAVVDAYEEMTTKAKKPLSPEAAVKEINSGSGAQFDPACVEAFARLHKGGRFRNLPKPA